MKIAIPVVDKQLCLHFGHCAQFALVDVDDANKEITAPPMPNPLRTSRRSAQMAP
jgi:predicted Fe-Mo cluster-binding NifX family protein